MDTIGNIGLTSGEYILIDGFDELQFLDHVPYVEYALQGGKLGRDKENYYDALNCLTKYKFLGIKKHDKSYRIDYAGKAYVYSNYYEDADTTLENNETIYLQTSAVATISVHREWKEE